MAPQQLVADRYQVVRFIGQGGMGQVYEAVDRDLRQTVAIKLLHPEVAHSEELRERMRSEVLLARRIAHPAVCRVFDLFRHTDEGHDGAPRELLGIAMEYLPGETLAGRLGRPFSRAQARRWLAQLAEALTAAHAQGVVHLDIKPSNVLLVRRDGRTDAVLADFGVARALAEAGRDRGPGELLGTPEFLAPEVQRGEAVSPAADVFSLGRLIERVARAAEGAQGRAPNDWTRRSLNRWLRAASACCRERPDERLRSPAAVARALGASPRVSVTRAATFGALLIAATWAAWWVGGRGPGGPDPEITASFRAAVIEGEDALARSRPAAALPRCREAARWAAKLEREAQVRAQACVHEALGDLQGAAADYRAVWTLSPQDVDLALALARLEGRLGRGSQALDVIDGIDRPRPREDELRLLLAEAEAAATAQQPARKLAAAKRSRALLRGERGWAAGWSELLEAEALIALGRPDEAEPLVRSAASTLEGTDDRQGSARAELASADLLRRRGDREAAAPRYAGAVAAAEAAHLTALAARALRASAYAELERGNAESAVAFCTRALEILEPTEEAFERAATEALLGRALLSARAESEEARKRMEAGLTALERLGAREAAGDTALLLAELDSREGRLGDSRERLERTVSLRRQAGDVLGEVMARNFLAWVQVESGRMAEAASTVDEVMSHVPSMPAGEIRAFLLATAAIVRVEQDDPEAARELTQTARSLLGSRGSESIRAQLFNVEAELARALGERTVQERAAEEALAIARAAGWQERIAIAEANLAEILLDRGDVAAASDRLRRAAALPEARELAFVELIVGRETARLRAAEGDLDGALVDLEHLRRRAAESGFELQRGETELVLIETLSRAGRRREARAVATSLVERARARGLVRLERFGRERLAALSEAAEPG